MPFFMKFGKPSDKGTEVKGSAKEANHPGWLEIDSVQWSVNRPNRGRGESGGEALDEMSFSTSDPPAVARIWQACALGVKFDTVTIHGVHDGSVYLDVGLESVYVTSCQMGGVAGRSADPKPFISFTLSFSKMVVSRKGASASVPAHAYGLGRPTP